MSNTPAYILAKVAPIFNQKGYVGTSLSDITTATNLTKGAIYFHWKNKEDLAIAAFKYNLQLAIKPLAEQLQTMEGAIDKLNAIAAYYSRYYDRVMLLGGCPILNAGVDANANNALLHEVSKKAANSRVQTMAQIIEQGIRNNEINPTTDALKQAKNFYAMIEGAVFMAVMNCDPSYLTNITETMHEIIESKLKK